MYISNTGNHGEMQGYSASGAGYKIRRANLLWGPFFLIY